jgi:predicted ATPase
LTKAVFFIDEPEAHLSASRVIELALFNDEIQQEIERCLFAAGQVLVEKCLAVTSKLL